MRFLSILLGFSQLPALLHAAASVSGSYDES